MKSMQFRRMRRGGPPNSSMRPPSIRRRIATFLIAATLTCISPASAQDSNHYFCGTSWGDASENCDDRQHCPGGTDDECETAGHICFGGTTCDSRMGHGNAFKYANVPYDDISNTRFCGIDWAEAIDNCSFETHCPGGFSEECASGQSCYGGLKCNVQDLAEEAAKEEEAEGGKVTIANPIGKHDPKRHNFCGTSWGDANGKCSIWCPEGEDTDCPGGMGCFGNTECYYTDDLVPTATPVVPPTIAPTTEAPVDYKDPSNVRYCGITWSMAVINCSFETHCPNGNDDECPKGQTCHGGIMQCNMIDLLEKAEKITVPTYIPTMSPVGKDDPSNTKFCGKSWNLASENCSLETHCPDDECPEEQICYGGIGCNAAEMTPGPTGNPSEPPTDSPTFKPTAPTESPSLHPTTRTGSPTTANPTISPPPTPAPMIPWDDPRHSYYCGKNWKDVTENCHAPCTSGQDTECPAGMTCIAFTPCRPATRPPTQQPVTQNPSFAPSPPPTSIPTDLVVPTTNSPIAGSETSGPTFKVFTMQPVVIPSTENPTQTASVLAEAPEIQIEDTTTEEIYKEPQSALPTQRPSGKPTAKPNPNPTRNPTKNPTNPPQIALPPSTGGIPAPSHELIGKVGAILVSAAPGISNDVLVQIDIVTKEESPSQMYEYGGFINALGIISKGDMGSTYFYLGSNDNVDNPNYGLVNVALFLSQAEIETIQFGVCDEISWEKDVFGKYPLSNSCGQGRFVGASMVSYEDSNPCSEEEAFMACDADLTMTAVAETHAIFAGAPPPLACFPSTPTERFTGAWDPMMSCEQNGCSSYEGQTSGSIDPLSIPTANSFGKNHVEGCCWWGRGVFPRGSAGKCMIGKVNHFLGKKAYDEGRPSARYKEVDFCQDPSAICRGHYEESETNAEIRWLLGMLYWTKVQAYADDGGWSYISRLHEFVDGGMSDTEFLDDVSRIVTRGCHDQSSCGKPVQDSERREKFNQIMDYFGSAQANVSTVKLPNLTTPKPSSPVSTPSPSKRTLAPTPKPTSRPTPLPVIPVPTEYPTLRAVTGLDSSLPPDSKDDYKLSAEELAGRLNYENNYCASNSAEAKAKCASTLRTCNFGDPPCAPGLACFHLLRCSEDDYKLTAEEDSSLPPDSEDDYILTAFADEETPRPTPVPTTFSTMSESPTIVGGNIDGTPTWSGTAGGVVGDYSWSRTATPTVPQNNSELPPWLMNTVMTMNSGGPHSGNQRSLWLLVALASIHFFINC